LEGSFLIESLTIFREEIMVGSFDHELKFFFSFIDFMLGLEFLPASSKDRFTMTLSLGL
jgi:hypothetical protein